MKYLILSLALLITLQINAQNLINGRKTSYYTYIYQITDNEAESIYKHHSARIKNPILHTRVDSFLTGKEYLKKLPKGHYLKIYTNKNRLQVSITSVQPVTVHVLNDNTDLRFRVFDSTGTAIRNASVWIKHKRIRFDEITDCYVDAKSNRKGILKVSFKGFTSYYDLNRKYYNPAFIRLSRNIVYSKPLVYAWIPVHYVISLPIDAVKSISRGYPQGMIAGTQRFFRRMGRRIACMFSGEEYHSGRIRVMYKGFMVFNKPKYLPGDTVKLKAFVTDHKGNPIKRKAHLVLQTDNGDREISIVNPYRPGAYEYQFVLIDSLDLQLDRFYNIALNKNKRNIYTRNNFKYEQYELSAIRLTVRPEKENQYRGEKLKLFLTAKDENGLNLRDARIELVVTRSEIFEICQDHVFVPDTLYKKITVPDPDGKITLSIPDSIFPPANLRYNAHITLLTSDNDMKQESNLINFYYSKKEFALTLKNDSFSVAYLENNKQKPKNVKVYGIDQFNNATFIGHADLPSCFTLNPYYKLYRVISDSLAADLSVDDESLVNCYSERTNDSLGFYVENPRKLTFNYRLFNKNKDFLKGYGTELKYNGKNLSRKDLYLSIQYLWAGNMVSRNFKIPYEEYRLHIQVSEPNLLFPGQKTSASVQITDYRGKPVENADITAYGVTSKFDSESHAIPDFGKRQKTRSVINSFNIQQEENAETSFYLDYDAWKWLARLDTIEYYRFLYPGTSIYKNFSDPSNHLTQFAPFVMKSGQIRSIQVIYLDYKPVYFAWSNNKIPYSFPVESGYHQIRVRTTDKLFEIDSLYFPPQKKMILSFDESIHDPHVRIIQMKPELSASEKRVLYRYIMPYSLNNNSLEKNLEYLEQDGHIILLDFKEKYSWIKHLLGPVSQSSLTFKNAGGSKTNFDFEPFYEYNLKPGLIKMVSVDPQKKYPVKLLYPENLQNLDDEILTAGSLEKDWQDYLFQQKFNNARYLNATKTQPSNGAITIDYMGLPAKIPMHFLLFSYEDPSFAAIYPGDLRTFNDLPEGLYKLMAFFPGSLYFTQDSLTVIAGG